MLSIGLEWNKNLRTRCEY